MVCYITICTMYPKVEGETSTVTLSLAESEVNKEKKFALALFFKVSL